MNKRVGTLLLVIVSLLAVGGIIWTTAYFSSSASIENNMKMGNVDGVVSEPDWPSTPVLPNQLTPKNPRVVNTGANKAFVRIRVVQSDSRTNVAYYAGAKENPTLLFQTKGLASLPVGTRFGNWVYEEDGYFYYDAVLNAGAETQTLFDFIKVTDDNYAEGFDIYVMTELVQSTGILGSYSGNHVKDAKESFRVISQSASSTAQ